MPTPQQLVSGLLRNSGGSNFIDAQQPPVTAADELVPALNGRTRGAFKVDEGAFVPPDEIPNYGMPTSRILSGDNSQVLSRRSGDKSVGITDGRGAIHATIRPTPAPVDFLSEQFSEPISPPSALEQFQSFLDEPDMEAAPPEPMPDLLVEEEQAVPEEDELAAIESELAANEQLGSSNRRRVQDLIFN